MAADRPDRALPPGRPRAGLPDIARFALSASVRTASMSAVTGVRVGAIVARGALRAERPSEVLEAVAGEATEFARRLLELTDAAPGMSLAMRPPASSARPERPPRSVGEEERLPRQGPVRPAAPRDAPIHAGVVSTPVPGAPWLRVERADRRTLQQMYEALIEESNDVSHHEENHPAYVRVMSEITPDEARILRLLAQSGPQPSIDIRTAGTFGFGSKLVRPGVTMIAAHAGCQDAERVPSYLNNLHRLGLIWFSREMIGDVNSYALLEAQPEVLAAGEELGGKNKIRNTLRSIELTAFGRNLCSLCGLLPADELQTRATIGEVSGRLPAPDER